MKKRTLIYSMIALAALVLNAVVIRGGTDMPPPQSPLQQERMEGTTQTETSLDAKKKSCNCCANRVTRARELMRKARERRMVAKDSVSQQTPSDASNVP